MSPYEIFTPQSSLGYQWEVPFSTVLSIREFIDAAVKMKNEWESESYGNHGKISSSSLFGVAHSSSAGKKLFIETLAFRMLWEKLSLSLRSLWGADGAGRSEDWAGLAESPGNIFFSYSRLKLLVRELHEVEHRKKAHKVKASNLIWKLGEFQFVLMSRTFFPSPCLARFKLH